MGESMPRGTPELTPGRVDPKNPPNVDTARTITSADLLQGAREVLILHDEMTYRLRLTRNGKLILVK